MEYLGKDFISRKKEKQLKLSPDSGESFGESLRCHAAN
jgi:hypothetical protein